MIEGLIKKNEDINQKIKDLLYEKLQNLKDFKDIQSNKINNNKYKNNDNKDKINSFLVNDENFDLDESDLNNNKSFDLDLNTIEELDFEDKNKLKYIYDIFKMKILSIKKTAKYFDENLSNHLYESIFILNFNQNSLLNSQPNDDFLLSSLLAYIQEDLESFCENKKYDFINILNDYQKQKFIKTIVMDLSESIVLNDNEKFLFFKRMLKNRYNELKFNGSFCKIDYITILPVGISGV